MCRVNFDMSVKLSSITTAATKFNFGKSNLYDFIFFKSCHFITFCISSSPLGFSFYSFTHEFSANNSVITLLLMISESWRNVIVTFLNAWIWILKCDTSIFHILKLFTMVKNDVSDETKNLLVIKIKRSLAEFFTTCVL